MFNLQKKIIVQLIIYNANFLYTVVLKKKKKIFKFFVFKKFECQL